MAGTQQSASVSALTNGQLYDEWNEACWARIRGAKISPDYQTRLDQIEAELRLRPVEAA
jgi:hypothetical protein